MLTEPSTGYLKSFKICLLKFQWIKNRRDRSKRSWYFWPHLLSELLYPRNLIDWQSLLGVSQFCKSAHPFLRNASRTGSASSTSPSPCYAHPTAYSQNVRRRAGFKVPLPFWERDLGCRREAASLGVGHRLLSGEVYLMGPGTDIEGYLRDMSWKNNFIASHLFLQLVKLLAWNQCFSLFIICYLSP